MTSMPVLTDDYRRDGFAVARGLLDAAQIAPVLADLHALVRLQLTAAGGSPTGGLQDDMATLLRLDVQRYLAAVRRGAKLWRVQRLLTEPSVVECLRGLGHEVSSVCSEPVLHVVSDRLRIPDGYQGFAAHQDWTSIQGSLDCVVVWVPLVPVRAANFPLLVAPGSHRLGLLTGEITTHIYEVPKSVVGDDEFIPVEVDPGDVVLMSCWTVHKTGVDGCSGLRLASSIRYDNAVEPHFVERRYPCAYKKSVQREFFTPDFPSREQVLEVFE